MKKILLLFFVFLSITLLSQTYEPNFYVTDSLTVFGKILPIGTLVVDRTGVKTYQLTATTSTISQSLSTTASKVEIGSGSSDTDASDVDFNSNRGILRDYAVGDNIGGSTLNDFANWLYFVEPTVSILLNSSTLILKEIGTNTTINITGTVTNNGSATLQNQAINETVTSNLIGTWLGTDIDGAGLSFVFSPRETIAGDYTAHQYYVQAEVDWLDGGGSETGTATSTSRSVRGIYPYFYGVSTTDFTGATGTTIYSSSDLSNFVLIEGNKSVSFSGTGYAYFIIPKLNTSGGWSNTTITTIFDHNGFNVTSSFVASDVTITSTSLVVDYTLIEYRMYKAKSSSTYSSSPYIFNR